MCALARLDQAVSTRVAGLAKSLHQAALKELGAGARLNQALLGRWCFTLGNVCR
jgi:hypothetical protein